MDLRSLNLASPIRFCSSARIRLFFSPPKPNNKSSIRPFRTSLFPLSSLSPHLTPRSSPERGDVSSWSNDVAGSVPREKLLQVVLVSPQIPGNTGCIARTCAASAIGLHLVEPLGFQVDDTKLKRAGLDYWPFILCKYIALLSNAFGDKTLNMDAKAITSYFHFKYVVVKVHGSWTEFREYFRQKEGEKRLLAFTKRGTAIHSDFSYKRGDWLVFGSETCGLPPEALVDCNNESLGGGTIRIPMVETYVRCLNLSVSVGIAAYEASRQLNYEQLQSQPKACMDSENSFVSEDIYA